MNMMTAPIYHQNLVTFNNANLSIIDYNGQPYVPMRPIVEGMGLDWMGQYTKLKQRFASTIEEISTVAQDGKQRVMICLPLKKLFGWMMTISPNKVKPELKETIIKYQDECDDALWNYWTGKVSARRKAFDELNEIDMDDKVSKGKATFHSLGMHQRKKEKKINEQKRLSWMSKHIGFLDF
ncbi:phage antirepressor N-terminal domain-containing protein [Acinetobacter gyllenbergii]|uniref:phage antirepressor N-terminal domain-containing protein n=1 Tax=Acinetobacter gyllenbergii TaxID=134534 RepID=UPI000806D32D|nr:phage antirepressor N-terminal domain-containing protein [Acinetobacter gyllenbergii]OBY75916.1 antirepressor [Acinetobacter gyllenbergii]